MTSVMFWAAVLGIAVQFVLIYGAIRLALRDDRSAPARAAARDLAAETRTTTRGPAT